MNVTTFLQDGTYAEAIYTYLNADISGVDKSGSKTDDTAESYDFFRYVDKNLAVSVGGKYLKFGDAEGALPTRTIVFDFEDKDGYVVGVKLSYQDK